MKQYTAHIECNSTGWYSVYVEEDTPFGLIGEGNTEQEAIQDFLAVYEAMRKAHYERTGERCEMSFRFVLDMSALLNKYKNFISLVGLSKLTGINKAQLSQYVCGTRKPSPKTEERIKASVRAFAQELSEVFA